MLEVRMGYILSDLKLKYCIQLVVLQILHECNSYKTDDLGLAIDRVYTGKKNIPEHIIEAIKDKRTYHNFYLKRIESRVKSDIDLVRKIKKEISYKE